MTATLSPRVRTAMIIGALALAAVGAGWMLLGRTQASSSASPGPTTVPESTPTTATTLTTSATPGVTPPVQPPAEAPPETPGDRLPSAIAGPLSANHVVVVSLYDPNAKFDETVLREAQSGAQLAGTTFVQVDVTQDDLTALNARYGVIQAPAVLVLRPPGDLVVRIDGFADRDTVAQAAANAAS